MTAASSDSSSAGKQRRSADADEASAVLQPEDQFQLFWQSNRSLILVGCVAVLIAIIGYGVWERSTRQKELDVEKAYAAATTPESLKAFAESNRGHALAGAAYLRVADEAFAANKSAEAATNYEKAIESLKEPALVARAKLGVAMAKIGDGKTAEGAAALKQLAEDSSQFRGVRAEAAYHLASLSASTGAVADATKYAELAIQIDPSSPWMQRAAMLRASLPPSAAPADSKKEAAPVAPAAIQFSPKK
jgi:predicted negative regulator of RcsB-dependent stress response